jgi:hypothetical protein
MRLHFTTSFMNLALTLFETPEPDDAETYVALTAGSYEPAPTEDVEYDEDDPEEFGFTAP